MWSLFHPIGDFLLLILAISISLIAQRLRPRSVTEPDVLDRGAASTTRSYLLIFALALAGSAAVSLVWRFPQPRTHDEFGQLLSADTLASGRLSNQPHPRWTHFESFHILQQPKYVSRYPPAPGLFMAAGQLLGGHPIVGVWLMTALGSTAIYWMLRGWLPPPWALFGGLLVVLRLGIGGYWSQSYFGAWAASLGGALLFGGLRRTLARPSYLHSFVLALGLAILATSRPFEGVVAAVPSAVLLLVHIVRRHQAGQRDSLRLIVLPIVLALIATALLLISFNRATTGDFFRHPHQLYAETYMTAPYFLFQAPRPRPDYNHPEMARLHDRWERGLYERQLTPGGWLEEKTLMLSMAWRFYLGVGLSIPLLLLFRARSDPWLLFAVGSLAFYLLVNLFMMPPNLPHYSAPLAPLLFFLVVLGVQSTYESRRWQNIGFHLRRALPTLGLMTLGLALIEPQGLWSGPNPKWHLERARILQELEEQGGQHLIIVRYRRQPPMHYPHDEWVYNEADIDSADVIWAREMSAWKTRRLLRYFRGRQIWLLEADVEKPQLVPYPRPSSPPAPG